MSKLDASRFLANLHSLFAPNIADGQEFIAYIDGESNSLVIQGDNILYPSAGNANIGELSYQLKNTSNQIKGLQNKADDVENLCKAIPGFVTNIESISGQFEGTSEFAFDLLYFDIITLKEELADLNDKIISLQTLFLSLNSSETSNTNDVSVTVSSLERKFEALQSSVDALASELHSQVVEEKRFNLDD